LYITEIDLLKAKLEAGGALNESRILREILFEDKKSERKKKMYTGERYFRCEHDVLAKNFQQIPISETSQGGEKDSLRLFHNPNRSNHHCVSPFHHMLVAQKAAYLAGREPTITAKGTEAAFDEMLNRFADERFNATLYQWIVGAANKGVEYLHVYYDEEGGLKYCVVPAQEVIAVYDERNQQELQEIIRYYDITVLENGRERSKRKVEWWTKSHVTYFAEEKDGEFRKSEESGHWTVTKVVDGEAVQVEEHGWGRVPFIELRNNDKEMTDLELIKGLVDAYDLISSEGTNNLLDLVDLYWVIQGYGGETAGAIAKKLQINKAVQINDSSGRVDAKQVTLPVDGRLRWLKMLRKDIFHFGMGIDMDTENLGKAPSGVALKFQYATFYLKVNGIVPEIRRAIKELIRFVTEDHNRRRGVNWDWRDVQVILNTSSITDDLETIQVIEASKGLISEKTLLGKHPFIDDVNGEMERLKEERSVRGEGL